MKRLITLAIVFVVLGITGIAEAQTSLLCGLSTGSCGNSPVQGNILFNSQTTGAANTAVTATLTGVQGTRAHVYSLNAWCSAGTAQITITDGATTIFTTLAAEVTTTRLRIEWPTGLTGTTATTMTVTLSTCGVGNTGTLSVQGDRF